MGFPLRQSTASQEVPLGHFVDDDGFTAATGLTIANTDIKIHKAGATTVADKNSGGGTHISGGIYYAVLDATDTNTVGPLTIFINVSGALPVRLECFVYEEAVYDQFFAASAAGYQVPIWAAANSTVNLSATTVKTATDVEADTADIQSRLPAALGANGNIKADVRDFSGTAGTFSSGRPEVNASHVAGTAQTAGDLIGQLRSRLPVKTWYVATTANDSNAGTKEAPFLTIGAAVTAGASFDKIKIANGTYDAVVDLDSANKFGMHLIGESRTGVIITGTVASFFAVIMLEHGTTLENLTVTPNGTDGTGASGFDKHNISFINCNINGYWDAGLVAFNTVNPRGLRGIGCKFSASFDGFNFTGCKDFYFADCTFSTDGTYTGPQDNNAARGEVNSPTGTFYNCTFDVANGVAHAGQTKDGTCVTLGGADTDVRFEKCTFKGRKTSGTDHGRLIGIGTEEDTPVVYRSALKECKFDLVHSGDGAVYEIDNPISGTSVTVDATPITVARISTIGNLRSDLVPSVSGRTLDVSSGGEAGVDWANVGSPTTTQNLSGTTTSVVGSVTGAVGSVTGNVGGNVAGSVGSVTGNVGGNVVGTVASVVGNVGGNVTGTVASVVGNLGGNVTGSIGSLAAQAKADVNAEVDTAISDVGLTTTITGRIDAAISTRSTVTTAQVNAEVDTALADIGLDHLVSAAVVGADVTDNSIIAKLVSKSATADWDSYVNTTDALEAVRDRGDAGWVTATGFSTHSAADVWAVGTRTVTAATNITSTGGTITVSSGKVTVGTNDDKTGYALTQTFPTNFEDLAIADTTGKVTADVTLSQDNIDDIAEAVAESVGVSPFNVDSDHTWKFDNPAQITAPNIIPEFIGFIGLLAMDFTVPMPSRSSINSVTSATFANDSGTEPTVTSAIASADKKKVNVLIDATLATAGTYTLSVKIVTTDSQTFVRKGRVTIS